MRKLILTAVAASATLMFQAGCGQKTESSSTDQVEKSATATQEVNLPSLQDQLDAKRMSFEERAPAQMRDLYNSAVSDLRISGILDSMLNVGDKAPDFKLPSADGKSVSLSSLLETGPVVLAWYRGGWCPYCNLELLALNDAMSYIEDAGATLVAVSPEIPDSAANTVKRDSLDFVVLSDVGNVVARQFGIVFTLPDPIIESYSAHFDVTAYNADDSYTLPLAATYVIDTDGTITYAFADADYRVRAEPAVVVKEVMKLTTPGS